MLFAQFSSFQEECPCGRSLLPVLNFWKPTSFLLLLPQVCGCKYKTIVNLHVHVCGNAPAAGTHHTISLSLSLSLWLTPFTHLCCLFHNDAGDDFLKLWLTVRSCSICLYFLLLFKLVTKILGSLLVSVTITLARKIAFVLLLEYLLPYSSGTCPWTLIWH